MTDTRVRSSVLPGSGVVAAFVLTVALACVGLFASRPDVVFLSFPIAGWLIWTLVHRRTLPAPLIELHAEVGEAHPQATLSAVTAAEVVQVHVRLDDSAEYELIVSGTSDPVRLRARLLHSGPTKLAVAIARGIDLDGARATPASALAVAEWDATPASVPLRNYPVARRLPGMHGAHDGARLGAGGEFRDIHAFVPGDDLRRVDWRASARLARHPGELFVRRTHTTSDASVVIVVDTADELGSVVAQWGSDDRDRSGATSLDFAREGARSFAEAAIAAGDRIGYIELAMRGRIVRSGGGKRHLSQVLSAISATGPRADGERYERTPVVPSGSTIVLLSTFLDGDASRLGVTWAANGHRVIGVDTLPSPEAHRLTQEQDLALRLLLAERAEVVRKLRAAGVSVLTWSAAPGEMSGALGQIAREGAR